MSDFGFDNSISIDDILSEFHAEFDAPPLPEEQLTAGGQLGELDLGMGQVQKDVPTPEQAEEERRRHMPTEEEVRAYMAGAMRTDYLDLNEDMASPVPDHEEIDRRFRVEGSEPETAVTFGGEEVDTGADPDYRPSVQAVSPREADRKPKKLSVRKLRREKKLTADAEAARIKTRDSEAFDGFTSYAIPVADPKLDEGFDYGDDRVSAYDKDSLVPSTFGAYVTSIFAGILFKLRRQRVPDRPGDEDESDENLGKELKPLDASKYYGSHIQSLRFRFRLAVLLWLVMLWISLGLPVTGLLKSVKTASALCCGLQLTVLLLGLDVFSNTFMNVLNGKAGADLLASVACIITTADALMVARSSSVTPHMPLCMLSTLSFLGVFLASLLNTRSLRKTFRVPAIGKSVYAVTAERAGEKLGPVLLKSVRPVAGFVRRAEEAPADEIAFSRWSPVILSAALLFSVVTALLKGAFSDVVFIFSAILTPAVPVTALLGFAIPFFASSMRIFSSGAAIAGWSGICDVGPAKDLIVTDRDIFPKGTVEIDDIRIYFDVDPHTVISYAGSLIAPCTMACSQAFIDIMKSYGAEKMNVENIEFISAGGIKGIIGGQRVLCGTVEMMRLMGIRLPQQKHLGTNIILLAIDGIICGIFHIKYTPLKKVREALISLTGSRLHGVFAVRDFNITPGSLRDMFDIATDGYDFPPYIDRFEISAAKAEKDTKISAVVCREALGPLVDMADAGTAVFKTTRFNTGLSLAASVFGLLYSFIALLVAGTVTLKGLFTIMLLFALPVPFISFLSLRKR